MNFPQSKRIIKTRRKAQSQTAVEFIAYVFFTMLLITFFLYFLSTSFSIKEEIKEKRNVDLLNRVCSYVFLVYQMGDGFFIQKKISLPQYSYFESEGDMLYFIVNSSSNIYFYSCTLPTRSNISIKKSGTYIIKNEGGRIYVEKE